MMGILGRESNIYKVGFSIKKKNGAFRKFQSSTQLEYWVSLEEWGRMEPEGPGPFHEDFMQQCFEHLQLKILKDRKYLSEFL